jgi:hypothetical protein
LKELDSMAWCVSREYGIVLSDLLDLAENEDMASAKLIYMETLEEVEIASRQENVAFLKAFKSVVLSRLISIHREQRNLPALERMWKSLHNQQDTTKSVFDSDTATRLATIVQESPWTFWGALLDVTKRPIDSQLYPASETLFPALHRACQEGEEHIQQIFQSTASAIRDVERQRHSATEIHVSSAESVSLEHLDGSDVVGQVMPVQRVEQRESSSAYIQEITDEEHVFQRPRYTIATDLLTTCPAVRAQSTPGKVRKTTVSKPIYTLRFPLVDSKSTGSDDRQSSPEHLYLASGKAPQMTKIPHPTRLNRSKDRVESGIRPVIPPTARLI